MQSISTDFGTGAGGPDGLRPVRVSGRGAHDDEDEGADVGSGQQQQQYAPGGLRYNVFDLLDYIPLRLSADERSQLELLLKALDVSEYTDHVDARYSYNRDEIVRENLHDLYTIIIGLQHSANYHIGRKLTTDELAAHKDYFANLFEIGRRYKVMNPDRMRAEYGKLLFVLQDACSSAMERNFRFTPMRPITTVATILSDLGLRKRIENDPRVLEATKPLREMSQEQLQQEKKAKETLLRQLCDEYIPNRTEQKKSYDLFERALRSIDDANCYIRDNVETLDQLLGYLHKYFNSKDGENISIRPPEGGARLYHSHDEQYHYVWQSLELWKRVSLHMFRLWQVVESDMLSGSGYRFRNTGQGYNRVQSAPKTSGAMGELVRSTQSASKKRWQGLSAVHMGDDQVPNALTFIDKYTAVSRIVNPILKCVQGIEAVQEWPGITDYIEEVFGSKEKLILRILKDYFKHGFDGSGGDNPADAGSCIDGRLTSSWNWCNKIDKKDFYPVFLLTGFSSFDAMN